jgi:hypothetical protein
VRYLLLPCRSSPSIEICWGGTWSTRERQACIHVGHGCSDCMGPAMCLDHNKEKAAVHCPEHSFPCGPYDEVECPSPARNGHLQSPSEGACEKEGQGLCDACPKRKVGEHVTCRCRTNSSKHCGSIACLHPDGLQTQYSCWLPASTPVSAEPHPPTHPPQDTP